jgi:hypothetical protein
MEPSGRNPWQSLANGTAWPVVLALLPIGNDAMARCRGLA